MNIRVLGPLVAEIGEITFTPRPAQQRQVLSLLAMAPNRVVPVRELRQELWSEGPPNCALTVIQTYVVALRKILAKGLNRSPREVSQHTLTTHRDGYSLHLDPDALDAHRFETCARQGSRALGADDAEAAATYLTQALALWRGPVLADLRSGPVLDLEVTRLNLAWLATIEQRIAADLQLGRHYEVLAELSTLTARRPLDETLHQQYMFALHRTGRRCHALQAYHRLRDTLITELGMEPCRSAQRLHQAILVADPALDLDRRPGAAV